MSRVHIIARLAGALVRVTTQRWGVQEARGVDPCRTAQGYHILASPSEDGQLGVEFWASLQVPYCWVDGEPQYIRPESLKVFHADPRVLIQMLPVFLLVDVR